MSKNCWLYKKWIFWPIFLHFWGIFLRRKAINPLLSSRSKGSWNLINSLMGERGAKAWRKLDLSQIFWNNALFCRQQFLQTRFFVKKKCWVELITMGCALEGFLRIFCSLQKKLWCFLNKSNTNMSFFAEIGCALFWFISHSTMPPTSSLFTDSPNFPAFELDALMQNVLVWKYC